MGNTRVKKGIIKKLKEKTGCETIDCKMALEFTLGSYDVAYEFLMITKDSIAQRFHDVRGQLIPWLTSEYVEEAYRMVMARQIKEIEEHSKGDVINDSIPD